MKRNNWILILAAIFLTVLILTQGGEAEWEKKTLQERVLLGAYYFDGWAGRNSLAGNSNEPWAQNAPTHLTKRMIEEFPEREPIWGWRDDSLEIMERQIDLAADHGLKFFAFCWYWHDNERDINEKAIMEYPCNTGLQLFLRAKNIQRLRFCLLIANHQGHEIKGAMRWKQAADFWMPYFKHPQHLKVDGKPLLIVFNVKGSEKAGFVYMQESARRAGLPGVAIAGCAGGDPEMGYTHRTDYNVTLGYAAGSEGHAYSELMKAHRLFWKGNHRQPYIPIITAGWDKRPWEGPSGQNTAPGWYFPDRTPEQFVKLVRESMVWMDKNPSKTTAERIVLIYAWNEFGEGGYIAPTKGDPGGQYLKALQSLLIAPAFSK